MQTIKDKTIDGVPVTVNIVPVRNPRVTPNYVMNPKYITIHNTGNSSKTANANAHMRLLHRNSSNPNAPYASYHFVVDDFEIVQLIKIDRSAWHTGDGSSPTSGNRTSIGIEICMNRDGDYAKAEANAVKLIHYLVKKTGIPYANVVPHQKWSGKYCPSVILGRKGGWNAFHKGLSGKATPAPKAVSGGNYTVKSGDTLSEIAVSNKTTVAKLKKDNGLTSDLIKVGQKLVVKAGATPAKTTAKAPELTLEQKVRKLGVLKKGSKGEGVRTLQTALNKLYFKVGKVDGSYGAVTMDAVTRFQKVNTPYDVDGIFGSKTKAALIHKI